jgi:hypothetical protein
MTLEFGSRFAYADDMKILFATLLLAFGALCFGQTPPPAAPACLSVPVTKGTVTVSCSGVDNTTTLINAESGVFAAYPPAYLLVVKAVSTDVEVVAFRITVTYAIGDAQTETRVGLATKTPTSLPDPVSLGYVFALRTEKVISIKVQEMRAVSEADF